MPFRRRLVFSCAVVGVFCASMAAAAGPVGFKLMVQPWDIAIDDDDVRVPVDDPALVSTAITEAWRDHEADLRNAIVAALATPDYIADGVTLGDIVLTLPAPVLTLNYRSGGGANPLALRVTLAMPQTSIEATSTTPPIVLGVGLGAFADPRCSAKADLTVALDLVVGTDLAQPLRVEHGEESLTISNFSWDSQNFPCDVIKGAVGLVGAEGLIKQLVESPALVRPLAIRFAALADAALGAANAQIAGVVPPGLGLMNAWLAGAPGGGQVVALYLGLRAPIPDPGPRATISGTMRLADGTPAGSFDCRQMRLDVDRKAGPRPVLNAFGTLGDASLERLATSIACDAPGPDGAVTYRLSGLSAAFPNIFTIHGLDVGCRSGEEWETGTFIDTSAWPDDAGLSASLGEPFDVVARQMQVPCPPMFEAPRNVNDIVNPLLDPDYLVSLAELLNQIETNPGANRFVTVLNDGMLTSLNPQPLPPSPVDAAASLLQQLRLQGQLSALNPQPLPPSPAEISVNVLRQLDLQNQIIGLQQQQIDFQRQQLGR